MRNFKLILALGLSAMTLGLVAGASHPRSRTQRSSPGSMTMSTSARTIPTSARTASAVRSVAPSRPGSSLAHLRPPAQVRVQPRHSSQLGSDCSA
jgi:hypothetical protein